MSGETGAPRCEGCGEELPAGAKTKHHGGNCRQRAYRKRGRLNDPDHGLLVRHRRAMKYIESVGDPDRRYDVLYAVLMPEQWRQAVGL